MKLFHNHMLSAVIYGVSKPVTDIDGAISNARKIFLFQRWSLLYKSDGLAAHSKLVSEYSVSLRR